MRHLVVAITIVISTLVSASCGDSTPPASPSPAVAATASAESTGGAAAIGLSGVIRGLDLRNSSFSLLTRGGTHQIRIDSRTQVWSGGAQVRAAALKEGQSVTIRGSDYGTHVVAVTISITR